MELGEADLQLKSLLGIIMWSIYLLAVVQCVFVQRSISYDAIGVGSCRLTCVLRWPGRAMPKLRGASTRSLAVTCTCGMVFARIVQALRANTSFSSARTLISLDFQSLPFKVKTDDEMLCSRLSKYQVVHQFCSCLRSQIQLEIHLQQVYANHE